MEGLSYQEEQITEQKKILKQWFPFSRIGLFYFSILVGNNLLALIVAGAILLYLTIRATILGGATDIMAISQSVNAMLMENLALIMLISYAITVPLSMLIVKSTPTYKDFPKEKWKISKLLLLLMISIGVMMAGNIISLMGQGLVTLVTGHEMSNPLNAILNDDNIIGGIVMVVLIAPIIEEFLFRKVLLDRVRIYGDRVAILLSGILFGLFHGNLFQVVYATMLGMVLAYVYLKTKRISYCIGLHMLINIIGGVLPLLLYQGIDLDAINDMQEIMHVAPQLVGISMILILEIACMIASIVVFIQFRKRLVLSPAIIEIEKGTRFKTICLNVGMILLFAISMVTFIINAMA